MPWTPESNQPLSEDLDAIALEESSMKLWQEFLAGYFDGATHFQVGYPRAELSFQQAKPSQPLDVQDGVNIHIVANLDGDTRTRCQFAPGKQTAYTKLAWTFTVRASVKTPRPDGHNSQSLARWTADVLHGLLLNPAALLPLHRAGLMRIRPKPPKAVQSPDYAMRLLVVKATLVFAAQSQPILAANNDVLVVGSSYLPLSLTLPDQSTS